VSLTSMSKLCTKRSKAKTKWCSIMTPRSAWLNQRAHSQAPLQTGGTSGGACRRSRMCCRHKPTLDSGTTHGQTRRFRIWKWALPLQESFWTCNDALGGIQRAVRSLSAATCRPWKDAVLVGGQIISCEQFSQIRQHGVELCVGAGCR